MRRTIAALIAIGALSGCANHGDLLAECTFGHGNLPQTSFLIKKDSLLIIDGPGAQRGTDPDLTWGTPILKASRRKISINFPEMKATFRGQGVTSQIVIDVPSGRAYRMLLASPRQGLAQDEVLFAQSGQCDVSNGRSE